VYTNTRLHDSGKVPELEVELKERANSKAICSGCGKKRSGYGYNRLLRRRSLMNWFKVKGQFSSGIVEGFNNKVKLTVRKVYGFWTFIRHKLHCFMHLAHYLYQKQPKKFSEEAFSFLLVVVVLKR
jgi:hypothetical protein